MSETDDTKRQMTHREDWLLYFLIVVFTVATWAAFATGGGCG